MISALDPSDSVPSGAVSDPAEVADLAARLRLSTTRLARRLRQEAEVGLSPTMLSALAVIGARGPLTLGSLADIEGVAPPTITKVVDRLEADGLVERIIDDSDRRVRHVECTGVGMRILQTSRDRKTAWLTSRLSGFDPAETDTLATAVEILERLAAGDAR